MKKIIEFIKKHWLKMVLSWLIVCLAAGLVAGYREGNPLAKGGKHKDSIEEVEYREFLQLAKAGKVDTVYYSVSDERMEFTLFNKETKKMSKEERKDYEYGEEDRRITLYPSYPEFRKDLLELGVNLSLKKTSRLNSDTVFNLVFLLVSLVMFGLVLNLVFGGASDGSVKTAKEIDVTFKDIIGLDEVVQDVKFIVDLLKEPERGTEIGVKPPKGILLSGEPGCGKTLIAKAIAGEAGVPFFYASGASFDEMFVGLGAKRVRDLFKKARAQTPCVVFIDEIDAVGASRTNDFKRSNEQTLNELLAQMDGFDSKDGIFVIAATNRLDMLDSALVRPGRFDRHVLITPPRDWKARRDLFSYYLSQYSVADSVSAEALAKQTPGFTGADVESVCNESALIAMQKGLSVIDLDCITEAIDKKIFKGSRSKREQFERDREIVAYHEAGHAVASLVLGEPITRVSIVGMSSGVGGAVFGAEKDSSFKDDKEVLNRVIIAYSGRASESIKFGIKTNGAMNDITQATELLKEYVYRCGFSADFGLLDLGVLQKDSVLDGGVLVDRLSKLSKECYGEALDLLNENYGKVEAIAKALLSKETLMAEEVQQLLEEQCS